MQRSDLLIDANLLDAERTDPALLVLDCRFDLADKRAGRRAYRKAHIPGARYADLERDLSAPVRPGSGRHPLPSPGRAVDAFRGLGVRNDSRVVVYDDTGGAYASRAWWMLRWLGHGQVRLLDGGFPAWTAAGLPTESGDIGGRRGDFVGEPRKERVIETRELSELDLNNTPLCDAREPSRFAGEAEPIDLEAGHIPGARNTPYSATLDECGCFLDAERLASFWVQALDGRPQRDWVAMCGSGVTACHLAVSALLAGANEPRLYAGSWSEWITDSTRPLATGKQGADTAR